MTAPHTTPAPPTSVQEIIRLMIPYVGACVKYKHIVAAGPELDAAFRTVEEAFKPLETALTALVEKNHELQFALDGVNAMRKLDEWRPIETAPKDGTEIQLYAPVQEYAGKPTPERVTCGYWLHEEPYIREHRDLDGRWIGQDESGGHDGWVSFDGGFTEENPPTHWMPRSQPPASHGIEPEQGEAKS